MMLKESELLNVIKETNLNKGDYTKFAMLYLMDQYNDQYKYIEKILSYNFILNKIIFVRKYCNIISFYYADYFTYSIIDIDSNKVSKLCADDEFAISIEIFEIDNVNILFEPL
jgi:hypothetical protein